MGHLFALGSNGSGQLGTGHIDDVLTPVQVPVISHTQIKSLVAGGNHSVVLLADQSIATSGENDDGRCFVPTDRAKSSHFSTTSPHVDEVGNEDPIRIIAATWSATLAVCRTGRVTVCGSGNAGELGLGEGTRSAREPKLIEQFPPPGTVIVRMAACMAHTVAVLSNGEVWGWGQGRRGQLGQPSQVVWQPRKIMGIEFFAVDAVCGKEFTCIVGSPSTGELLVLGSQTKDRFAVHSGAPKAVRGWKQIAASWGSVYVLLSSGTLITWGRDDHGQLAPPGLPPLVSIAAGSEHCLGIDEVGNVLAWGWGEHGNCGEPIDSGGNIKGRWNELAIPRRASAVFAGCATSFIVA